MTTSPSVARTPRKPSRAAPPPPPASSPAAAGVDAAPQQGPLRIRLLEPDSGVIHGGTRVLIHGKGFRPLPHSLLVRFHLQNASGASVRLEVTGRFVLETQLECTVPDFGPEATRLLSHYTNLPPTSATVALAPFLVPLRVEVIMDSERVSNALPFHLHQPLAIHRITPQFVLMTPPTTITATLNLLKLTPQRKLMTTPTTVTGTTVTAQDELREISSLPVSLRIRQTSERTGAVSERIVPGRWRISVVGVYEIDFEAVMMTFGDATVELTLNRCDFFHGRDRTTSDAALVPVPASTATSSGSGGALLGYRVARDVSLESIDPPCISVTSGKMTEVRLRGEGFLDTGDLVVCLLQRDISDMQAVADSQHRQSMTAANSPASASTWTAPTLPSPALTPTPPESLVPMPVAQINATFTNQNEIRCSIHPNMSFGLTHFMVSLNGGRQFGRDRAVALLYRERVVESVTPAFGSLEGHGLVTIRYRCVTVEDVDAPQQVHSLVPPRRIRVRFQAAGGGAPGITKVVQAEDPIRTPTGWEHGVVRCRVPSFLEDVRRQDHDAAQHRVRGFHVSLALAGDTFFGSVPFGLYFPPVIKSITQHHGPATGGTVLVLRMKHRVSAELPIQIRFLSLTSGHAQCVPGILGTDHFGHQQREPGEPQGPLSPLRADDDPAFLLACTTPVWRPDAPALATTTALPELTKVQVSLDGGFDFVPALDDHERAWSALPLPGTPRGTAVGGNPMRARPTAMPPLVRDMSHLYFLFYEPPRLDAVVPMSADIQGGSYVRISGDHVIDHGGPVSVIFQSPQLSRKVAGFIENGEIRCCAPSFHVGPATIFVSFNAEQYTKCAFIDPDSRRPIDFVFYSSPSLNRLSPQCACLSHSSIISIFGVNLIETGRIKVRFGFANAQGKLVFRDVGGRAVRGVILAQSPLFPADYGDQHAVVDVALNGNDFSGTTLSLYYYSAYAIKRVEPRVGALEIPVPLTVVLSQHITSDTVLVRVRLRLSSSAAEKEDERVFGPEPVAAWQGNQVQFTLPPLVAWVPVLERLAGAAVDLSFDKTYFHCIGELLPHYRVYSLPEITDICPLFGPFDQETLLVARCTNLQAAGAETIKILLSIEVTATTTTTSSNSSGGVPLGRHGAQVEVVADVSPKRQQLSWRCPSLLYFIQLSGADTARLRLPEDSMLLGAKLTMKISMVSGQLKRLPFEFQFYRLPALRRMVPRVGYVCGGSLLTFEFNEPIATPTVDFRFGDAVASGRVRDGRFVECLSPELPKGQHELSFSFNEQHFEPAFLVEEARDEDDDDENQGGQEDGEASPIGARKSVPTATTTVPAVPTKRWRAVFQAVALPLFTIPDNPERVCGFGSVEGGTTVTIRGRGFIPEGKVFVRFCSPHAEAFACPGGRGAETIAKARVLDPERIQCVTPATTRPGRVLLQITYNLQQYTDSTCYFEYHAPTRYRSQGILCGPVHGGAPVCIAIADPTGLPANSAALVSGALRFVGDQGHAETVPAGFDPEALVLSCVAPPWPANELVAVHATLSHGPCEAFADTGIKFLFYDPPQGLINLEPPAGPIAGGTEVLAWCGKMVDTGEILVSVTLSDRPPPPLPSSTTTRRPDRPLDSVAEEDERGGDDDEIDNDPGENDENQKGDDDHDDEDDNDADEATTATAADDVRPDEVHVVRGKIIGEAVRFLAPAVTRAGVAFLNIALNGINYTSAQASTLRYTYYRDPVVHRITPTWSTIDAPVEVTISGEFIRDYGCRPRVRFRLQQPAASANASTSTSPTTTTTTTEQETIVNARVVKVEATTGDGRTRRRALRCVFQAPHPGFYELDLSLNGQQFFSPRFMNAKLANYSGSACTALLPFRCFAGPFQLATPTGPVAGGSTVVLHLHRRLARLLARETRCQVQFAPIRHSSAEMASLAAGDGGSTSSIAGAPAGGTGSTTGGQPVVDVVSVTGELDHAGARVTCRAPLLRAACVATIDVVLPLNPETKSSSTSCAAFFGVKERERFFAYESPSIAELTPNCGPVSGGTRLVIEGANILDTGQIFVRFRSSLNERECVLIPGEYSRTFPDGSVSGAPVILCQAPAIEYVERLGASTSDLMPPSAATAAAAASVAVGGGGVPMTPAKSSRDAVASSARARASVYQQLAESSLRDAGRPVLRITRALLPKATTTTSSTAAGSGGVSVLVDFTLNAGEQFIAHSVPFFFHADVEPVDVRWSPRHLPTRAFERVPTETRLLTIQLPRAFRLTDAPDRVCVYFDGAPQQIYPKRRGSSVVLHETSGANELLLFDMPSRLKTQASMRRRSTYARNSSLSASSNNVLGSGGAAAAAVGFTSSSPASPRGRPMPPPPRSPPRTPRAAANALTPAATAGSGGTSNSTSNGSGTPSSTTGPPTQKPPPASASSPFFAAKVLKGNELTCPVPEFGAPGRVRVFFSANAQQFVCLGELHIHEPLSIREDPQYRFCSNVGGDAFAVHCSPSTVLEHLPPRLLTSEAELARAPAPEAGLARQSRVLSAASPRGGGGDSGKQPPTRPATMLRQDSNLTGCWGDRLFHIVQVHVLPPNARLRRRVVVSASHLGTGVGPSAEIGTSSADDLGCCVFETTDWMRDVLLTATVQAPPPTTTTTTTTTPEMSAFSSVLCHKNPRKVTHALLVRLPAAGQIAIAGLGPGMRTRLRLLDRSGAAVGLKSVAAVDDRPRAPSTEDPVAADNSDNRQGDDDPDAGAGDGENADEPNDRVLLLVDPPPAGPSSTGRSSEWFVCVDRRPGGGVAESSATVGQFHVLVADATGVKTYLIGAADSGEHTPGLWVVARIATIESRATTITTVDAVLGGGSSELTDESLLGTTGEVPSAAVNRDPGLAQRDADTGGGGGGGGSGGSPIAVQIQFACADSSRNLSALAVARAILPGSTTLAALASEHPPRSLRLECAMPALVFNGPTTITLVIDGVVFSNTICVHCYDPRLWRITALDPPCTLVAKPVALRITGEHFVDNKKIVVRFTDAARFINAPGNLERFHLLIVRVAAVRNVRALAPPWAVTSTASATTASSTTGATSASPHKPQQQLQLHTPQRDDGNGGQGPAAASSYVATIRVECEGQRFSATCRESAAHVALHGGGALAWEDQFELHVHGLETARLVLALDLHEPTSGRASSTLPPRAATGMEIGRAVLALGGLQAGVLTRQTVAIEECFRWGVGVGAVAPATGGLHPPPRNGPVPDMDVLLHLSPPMLRSEVVVCHVDPFRAPQCLRVQISSGDSFFSPCEEAPRGGTALLTSSPTTTTTTSGDGSAFRPLFYVYELPEVTSIHPGVLPRSTGGELELTGRGFIGGPGGRAVVRVFGCVGASSSALSSLSPVDADAITAERSLLGRINAVTGLQPRTPEFFVRDLEGHVVSPTALRCTLPPHLATYCLYIRVSMDGRDFTVATPTTRVLLFSADAVEPRGGPVSGNTYVALHGTNVAACLATMSPRHRLQPVVRLAWLRGARALETVLVPGEAYPGEDVVYFYTPPSRFGLQNITLGIELGLVEAASSAPTDGGTSFGPSPAPGSAMAPNATTAAATAAKFTRDGIPFVVYRTPTIKALVGPTTGLICGLSVLEILVQGLDEAATAHLRSAHRLRFQRRGQMQVADAQLLGEGRLVAVVPRFNVPAAAAVEVPLSAVAGPHPTPSMPPAAAGARPQHPPGLATALAGLRAGPLRLWRRQGALVVTLLRARHLRASKKSTCNAFVMLQCNKHQRKSSRKDATTAPTWNEIFDFDWRAEHELPRVRFSVENQFSADQSELLGQAELSFVESDLARGFCFRAWLPLHKSLGGASGGAAPMTPRATPAPTTATRSTAVVPEDGEIEVAVAFVPMPPSKKSANRFLHAAALKSTILSTIQQHKRASEAATATATATTTATTTAPPTPTTTLKSKREALLRVFRRRGMPTSLVPSELSVELAINGQDFWSVAPTRCMSLPSPIVLGIEPPYVCLDGGTPVVISGLNFVATGCLRVAFAVSAGAAVVEIDKDRVAVVEAKYRSSSTLTCIAPALRALGPSESATISVFVALNGLDFDSIALPRTSLAPPTTASESSGTGTTTAIVAAASHRGRFVVDQRQLRGDDSPMPAVLVPRVHVYPRPVVTGIRPADGVYTSRIVLIGRDFSDTDCAIAQFTATSATEGDAAPDVRSAPVTFVARDRLECAVPDFPRGTIVSTRLAINGVEFVPCPGAFEICQAPRLAAVVPSWLALADASRDLVLRGINLTVRDGVAPTPTPTTVAETVEAAARGVRVAFVRGGRRAVVVGSCVDGEIRCAVPPTILPPATTADATTRAAVVECGDNNATDGEDDVDDDDDDDDDRGPGGNAQAVLPPPILVDVCLGGTHKTFTGQPAVVHVYRRAPTIASVTPTNGPIYGGATLTVDGAGFLDTGCLVVRFQASWVPGEHHPETPVTSDAPPPPIVGSGGLTVDAPGRFVSSERVQCTVPAFPHEGLYAVAVALNGVTFTPGPAVSASFFAWHNWQRRRQLLSMARPSAPTPSSAATTTTCADAGVMGLTPRPPTSEPGRLSPSSSPRPPLPLGAISTSASAASGAASPRSRPVGGLQKLLDDETLEHVDDRFVDPRLLQWHPASADDKGRPLATLLTALLTDPETQAIMIRRLGCVFRMRGTGSGAHRALDAGRFPGSLRLVFPHAVDRELDELWGRVVDSGHVTLAGLVRGLLGDDADPDALGRRRPRSPEPGPTHYAPSFEAVEPRAPAAVILPEVEAAERVAGLPSELFMNYDAFKAVRPRVRGGGFLRREPVASWCNPVADDRDDPEGALERAFAEQQRRHVATTAAASSMTSASLAHNDPPSRRRRRPPTKGPPHPRPKWVPPLLPRDERDEGDGDSTGGDGDSEGGGGGWGVSRGARLQAAAMASGAKASVPRSPRGLVTPPTAAATAGGATRPRSLLHEAIAPLYLKFLNSKEVQKTMKP